MVTERFVPSWDGLRLYTRTQGQGPTLVLCDGLGCDGFVWQRLWPEFAKTHQVLHWHFRGHGQSDRVENVGTMALADFRRDLLAVLDAHNISSAVFVGHSMGVQLLLDLALHAPKRVDGLVLMCGGYGYPLDTFHNTDIGNWVFPWFQGAVSRFPRLSQSLWQRCLRSKFAYASAAHFEINGALISAEDLQPYLDHLASMDASMCCALVAMLNGSTLEGRLCDIDTPALVVAGSKDSFTPAWLSHRMVKLLGCAELCELPSATHVAPMEMPELIWLRMEKFFRMHSLGMFAAAKKPQRSKRVRKSMKADAVQHGAIGS